MGANWLPSTSDHPNDVREACNAASMTTRHPIEWPTSTAGGRASAAITSATSAPYAQSSTRSACQGSRHAPADRRRRFDSVEQIRHLSIPVAMGASKSVDEDDRRADLAGDDMVDEWHVPCGNW